MNCTLIRPVRKVRPGAPARTQQLKAEQAQHGRKVVQWIINKWGTSLVKLCYKELLFFLITFFAISCIQHYALNGQQLLAFGELVAFFARYTSIISLPFLLGFYLTIIAGRWWQQYLAVPWPDRLMATLSMYVGGAGERRLRRTLTRRCLLMIVLLFRHISDCVRQRFPSTEHLVRYGLMSQEEKDHFDALLTDVNPFWVPGSWFVSTLRDAKARGLLPDAAGGQLIMQEFLELRSKCGLLWSYNWIAIPRVYGQVVKLAVYSFFAACLVGRQCVELDGRTCYIDRVLPASTVLEFLFYFGLLRVAEQMENPFGDDDEDFDLNFLIDRHVKAMRLDIDYLSDVHPTLEDDEASPKGRDGDAATACETSATPVPCPIVKITNH